ncbi:hypothetical protein ACFSTJ_11370 [Ottowia pentelensis]
MAVEFGDDLLGVMDMAGLNRKISIKNGFGAGVASASSYQT